MRLFQPNPGEDRTWTREKWKATDRLCRVASRRIEPFYIQKVRELMIYGSTTIGDKEARWVLQ